jgi:hypothetical protein
MGAVQSHRGETKDFGCAGSRQSCDVCCSRQERRQVLATNCQQTKMNAWAEALAADSESSPSRLGLLRARTHDRSPSPRTHDRSPSPRTRDRSPSPLARTEHAHGAHQHGRSPSPIRNANSTIHGPPGHVDLSYASFSCSGAGLDSRVAFDAYLLTIESSRGWWQRS